MSSFPGEISKYTAARTAGVERAPRRSGAHTAPATTLQRLLTAWPDWAYLEPSTNDGAQFIEGNDFR
jgi:hypothetical protein